MDDLHATLWKAADKLRGSMDAAHYKDFVLGLLFLRYASGEAGWSKLAARARDGSTDIGETIDKALAEVMRARPALSGVFLNVFTTVDQRRLADLVGLISEVAVSKPGGAGARDILGEAYEYFLEKFARAEGRRGGEFYTPSSVVRLLVEVLEPFHGTVYDPCCGSGGMFVQAEKFVLAHQGGPRDITILGQESNERTWRLARMNLAIHGITGDLGPRSADTFRDDQHPQVKADYILANPPFNMSDWARDPADDRWQFGVPPKGNANFAWLQHIIARLSDTGTAGVVLANGSMSSRQNGEGAIRSALIEANLVSCIVALPPQLFRTTQIPACLWFLSKSRDNGPRPAEVLFIDARTLGEMTSRTERSLLPSTITALADTYHAWQQTPSAAGKGLTYQDVPGFCYSAGLDEVRANEHILTPGLYVAAPEPAKDGEPPDAAIARLRKELYENLDESDRLAQALRHHLDTLDF